MFDLNNMMGKMQEMQANLKTAQENLVNITQTSESGGGMVKVTVNGKKMVVSIDIDPEIISKDDKVLIQDLIVAATNKAMEDIDPKVKEELQKSTGGMLPNIPGLDLGKFM